MRKFVSEHFSYFITIGPTLIRQKEHATFLPGVPVLSDRDCENKGLILIQTGIK